MSPSGALPALPDWRSLLFVPADRPDFIARAHTRGADAIQLDLEDAVAPAARPAARERLPEAIALLAGHGQSVVVRINRPWLDAMADLQAAVRPGVAAITLPKVEEPGRVQAIAELVGELEVARGMLPGAVGLLLLIESPAALPHLHALAGCSPRVLGMTLGPEDYCLAAGCEPHPEALLAPNLAVAQACAAQGRLPLGFVGSIADFHDLDAFGQRVAQARRLGFRGAAVIHPSQVPILNQGFGPTPEELAWASRVVAAAEQAGAAGEGAFRLDDRMIDRPVLLRARRWLARAGRSG